MYVVSDRILELIVLRLNGEQTLEEEQELNAWVDENPRHLGIWEEYQRLSVQIKSLNQPVQVDIESALRQVKVSRPALLSWRKMMAWAAVLILPLCVGIWLFLNSASEKSSRLFSEVASPGGGKAILKLGGQEQIFLNGGTDTLIIAGNGTKIKTDTGNMLSYQVRFTDNCLTTADNQLIVPRGGEYRITLGDGTRVWLNSASVLTFPQAFTGSQRRVTLSGEAYFEVKPDARHPFIVSTTRMDIKVLGTSFNVSAYKDEEMVQATLIKGSVEIRSPGWQELILTPGQQACLSVGEMVCKEVNVRQFTSWVDGKFMFCNTPLEEISRQISRWYDVDVFFSNENVKTVCFTGAILRFEPLEQLIRMIENTSNVCFSVKGKTIVISEQ